MARDIRGKGAELPKYFEAFRQSLAEHTDRALNAGQMLAFLKTNVLYAAEEQSAAAMTGFIEEFEPPDAALLFQVSAALAYEQNNTRLSLLFSSGKRSQLAEHKMIVAAAEAARYSLVHGPELDRFMSRFVEVASRSS